MRLFCCIFAELIMAELVNIHTHRSGESIQILNISSGQCSGEDKLYSMGMHPILTKGESELIQIEENIKAGKIIAVGESGLDRTSDIPLNQQIVWFEKQILLSEKYHLPLIIHCVRAFPELTSIHNKLHPVQAWIVHGYNNNREILTELLRHGLYISVGKAVMNKSSNIRMLLPDIPLNRMFLETDDSDYSIEDIYRQVALNLSLSIEKLQEIIYDNFRRLFSGAK